VQTLQLVKDAAFRTENGSSHDQNLAYLFQFRTRSEKTLQLVKDAATHETVVDIDTGSTLIPFTLIPNT